MLPALVVGATGQLGTAVVAELIAQGKPARAMVRRAEDRARFVTLGAEAVVADLSDPEALARAARERRR